jgi:hypothetical protein
LLFTIFTPSGVDFLMFYFIHFQQEKQQTHLENCEQNSNNVTFKQGFFVMKQASFLQETSTPSTTPTNIAQVLLNHAYGLKLC